MKKTKIKKIRMGVEYAEMMRKQCRGRVVPSKKQYSKKDRSANKVRF